MKIKQKIFEYKQKYYIDNHDLILIKNKKYNQEHKL